MKGARCGLLLCTALLLSACASRPVATPPATPAASVQHPHHLFGPRPAIPTTQELFTLDAAQAAALDAWMAGDPDADRHERLYEYLERITRRFNYQEDTFTASTALQLQRGNCLTLAIVTTAVARHTGVRISYQLVNDDPVFQFGGTAVLKGVHVRSLLHRQERSPEVYKVITPRSGLIIDYFPSGKERFVGNLSEAGFLASYYRNRATDFLQRSDLNQAWWYAQEAFDHDPHDADSINLLAVIGRRAGATDYAEAMYRQGIALARNKLSLLKNYRILLLAEGRDAEAAELEQRLARIDDPSPFHWFLLAQSAVDDGDLAGAIRYYRRALDLAPYLHEAWLGMAVANYQAGNLPRAREQLQQALDNVQRTSTRQSYKAKLLTLDRELAASR